MGGHGLEMRLCLCFLSAHSLCCISTQNIRDCALDGDALTPAQQLPGPVPVKELVCSSRDPATVVSGKLPVSYLSSEVSGVNVRGGALTCRYEDP